MRYISPKFTPPELSTWKAQSVGSATGYNDMPSEVKDAVRLALLHEQGELCAYTGQRIAPKKGRPASDSMHIEHVEPQAVNPARDTDYDNFVAAFPGNKYEHEQPGGRVTRKCPFGAHHRDDWWDQTEFIHPLRADCENAFEYKVDGTIIGKTPSAELTIVKLGLRDKELSRWRFEACETWKIMARKLSKAQLDEKIRSIFIPQNGKLDAFCFVILGVLVRERRRRFQNQFVSRS